MSQPETSREGSPSSGAGEVSKSSCVVHLVQNLVAATQNPKESHPVPEKFSDLAAGCALYRILHEVAPTIFTDVVSMEDPSGEEAEQQTIMKGNVIALIRHMNEYARNTLDARRNDFNLTAVVNASSIVQYGLHPDTTSKSKEGEEQLGVVTDLFVAMVALSGMSNMLGCLKNLPREEQKVLSNVTREVMQQYGLKGSRPSVDARRSARPSRFGSSVGTGASSPSNTLMDDGAYYRNKNLQLTKEMEDWKSKTNEIESKYALVLEDKKNLESKYKQLLAEMERRPSADALQSALRQREETVKALHIKVEEQESRLTSLKHAATAHEMQTEMTKLAVKKLEESIVRMMEERRDLENKLSIAEDKLTGQTKAREELQNEVEDLRSKVRLQQLSSKSGVHDGDGMLSNNASFASTGSVGRALVLEKEVTEVRRQRDNLQKQVMVLQRQFAAAAMSPQQRPHASDNHVAAQDTLKAQIRLLEREREQHKRQLQAAQEHIIELERQRITADAASASAGVTTPVRSASAVSGLPSDPTTSHSAGLSIPTRSGAATQGERAATDMSEEAALSTTHSAALPAFFKQQQALLGSMALSYAYQNVILQQHDVLLFKDKAEAEKEKKRKQQAILHQRGTMLSRQRLMLEEGLLESVVHNQILKKL